MIMVNGHLSELHSVRDRGLAYGDGLFETIAVKQRQPLLWDLHWERLASGCRRLKMDCPQEQALRSELAQLLGQADPDEQQQCVVKIIITRGIGSRGYRVDESSTATRIIMLNPWPEFPASNHHEGVHCVLCDTRLAAQPLLAGIKHLNRLEQVMARMEWRADNIAEGIMLDQQNNVIEGTMSNIFFVRTATELVTPSLPLCGIEGVQRSNVIKLSEQLDIRVSKEAISRDQLSGYNEAFLTNSLIGIWPVRVIGTLAYEPGPVTRRLQALMDV